MSESKTPRTDAEEKFIYGHIDRKWVTGDFAKSLEQELNAQYEENVHRIAEQAKAENERDQWRELAQDLAQELTDNLNPDLESPALERYNKLKEGK